MSTCHAMAQHMPSIDLPRPLSSDITSDNNRIPTPLSVIMQQQQQQKQQQQQQTSTTDPSVISVSSLRALALSTIRPKRKREVSASEALPASRRSSTQSPAAVTLDYGSESRDPQDETLYQTSPTTQNTMPPPPDSREEGEISDEEEIQSAPPIKVDVRMPPPESLYTGQASPSKSKVPPISTASSFMSLASDLPQQSVIRVNHQPQSPDLAMQDQELSPWANWVPTKDHVRPGLRMNMEQFNLVKELILDLLGWGVSPEYLVDCGLTREAVFYAFSELNLRLPSNLDHDAPQGLVPPTHPLNLAELSGQLSSNSMQPVSGETLANSLAASSSSKASIPVAPNLSDMEAQRRQELLARKAVLASRRKKPDTSAVSPDMNDGVEPVVPPEAVDTFLNNMLTDSGPRAASSAQVSSTASSLGSDLVGTFVHKSNESGVNSPHHLQISRPPLENPKGAKPSDNSRSRSDSCTPPVSRRSMTPNAPSLPANGKRVTKRPVAMDFVDDGSYTGPAGPCFVRRKKSSFAGLNQHASRKCVIDLSDSEGEDDGYTTVILDEPPVERRSVTPLARPPSVPTPVSMRGSIPSSSKGTPSPDVASGSLLEKEEQIKRMREMIQRREQERLRRLAEKVQGSPHTPPPTQTPPSSAASHAAKFKVRDEVPILPIQSGFFYVKRESPEPIALHEPAELVNTSDDQAEEDVVMKNLTNDVDEEMLGSTTSDAQDLMATCSISEPGRVEDIQDDPMSPPLVKIESNPSLPGSGDIDAPSAQDTDATDKIFSYTSPFSSYPLLRNQRPTTKTYAAGTFDLRSSVFVEIPHFSGSNLAPQLEVPDLGPLRMSLLSKLAGVDKFLCQYEVPGGGVCRDKTCTDLHLDDVKPSDQDVATYIKDMSGDALAQFSTNDIETYLAKARCKIVSDGGASNNIPSLEETVREALFMLHKSQSG